MEVKVNKIVGFTSSITGTADKYTLDANVSVDNGVLTSITSGSIKDSTGQIVANFTYYNNLAVNFVTTDATVMAAVITNVNDFITYVKTNASKLGTVTTEQKN